MPVLFRGSVYREAGVADVASWIAGKLFGWIYRLGLGKQQVIDWLRSLAPKKSAAAPSYIPEDLKVQMAQLLASTGMVMGDLIREIIKELDDPPPGFRWKKDPDTGDLRLVKQSYKAPEKGLHWGKKFDGKVFVGCWWATDKPTGGANRKLQNLLKNFNGGVFYKKKTAEYTDYFGYAILESTSQADAAGRTLMDAAEKVIEEGDGEYRLSAIDLTPMSDRRKLTAADVYRLTGVFRSIKYNHEINLDDLLMGRVPILKDPIKNLLKDYNK